MAVILTRHGGMSVRTTRPGDIVLSRGGGGARDLGMTTPETPTPSAELLFGTSAQREAQIAAFRAGGQAAFQAAVSQARQRAEAQKVAEREAVEQRRWEAAQAKRREQVKIAGILQRRGERIRAGQYYPEEVYERAEERYKERIAGAAARGAKIEFVPGGVRITEKPTEVKEEPTKFQKAEQDVSKFLEAKTIFKELTPERIEKFATVSAETAPFVKPVSVVGIDLAPKVSREFIEIEKGKQIGRIEFVKERPITTAALVGVGFVTPAAIAGIGAISKGVGGTLAGIEGAAAGAAVAKGVTIGAGVGLGGVFAADVAERVIRAETSREAGRILGETEAQVGAIAAGAGLGRVAIKGIEARALERGAIKRAKQFRLKQAEKPKKFIPEKVSDKQSEKIVRKLIKEKYDIERPMKIKKKPWVKVSDKKAEEIVRKLIKEKYDIDRPMRIKKKPWPKVSDKQSENIIRKLVKEKYDIGRPARIKKEPWVKVSDKELVKSALRFRKGKIPAYLETPTQKELLGELSKRIAIKEATKRGTDLRKISRVDRDFLRGQIEAKIRARPEKFLPEVSKIAIQKIRHESLLRKLPEVRRLALDKVIREPTKLPRAKKIITAKDIFKPDVDVKGFKEVKVGKQIQLLKLKPKLRPRLKVILKPRVPTAELARLATIPRMVGGLGLKLPSQAQEQRFRITPRTRLEEKFKERQLIALGLRLSQAEKQAIGLAQPQMLGLKLVQPQAQALATKQALRVRQATRQRFKPELLTIQKQIFKEPITLAPPFIFKLGKPRKRKKLRRIEKGIEDIAISEGFIARALGLKPVKIKRKEVRELAKIPTRALGIRRIPQVID